MANSTLSNEAFARRVLIAAGIVVLVGALVALAIRLAQVFLLVFAAVLFAIWLDGLSRLVQKWFNLGRRWALVATCVTLLLLIVAFIWFGGASISEQVTDMRQQVPAAFNRLRDQLMQYGWFRTVWAGAPDPEQIMASGSGMLGQVGGVFSTALGAMGAFFLVLVIGLYVVFEPRIYENSILAIVPREHRGRARELVGAITNALRWWLVARFAAMGVVGVLTAIGLMIVGVPLALTLALIAALLSFIPFLGPILAAVPAVLLALVESPVTALWVTGIYLGVQVFEENLFNPLIERRAVSLPPAAILSAQLVVGVLFGFAGVILSTPLAVAFIVTAQMLYVEEVLGDSAEVLGSK